MPLPEQTRKKLKFDQVGGRGGRGGHRYFVPGRIEVLGKHTDYAGGRSLLCAIDRGFRMAATTREDRTVILTDTRTDETWRTMFDDPVAGEPGWSVYPATVVRRLARNFPGPWRGADLRFESDLPPAAGISSSSAFVVAIFLALAAVNRLDEDERYASTIRNREELAGYLGAVENGLAYGPMAGEAGVGTSGGSEDHTAILCCQADTLSQYSFCPVRAERTIPMPAGHVFAIAASGVAAEKSGAARERYNQAAAGTTQLLRRWNAATGRTDGSLGAAVASSPGAASRIRAMVEPGTLRDRFEQFVEESERIVPAAGDAIAAGDLERFGTLVDRSLELAARLLRNQIPETMALARSARELGAMAASAFGAGFGGSVWALVAEADAASFTHNWRESYRRMFPAAAEHAEFFVTRAAASARALDTQEAS
jgi:galactokinase